MKDFLDNVLAIGDTVILIEPGYRNLVKGTVFAFTPKQVRVEYINDWNSNTPSRYELLQYPSQLVKVLA